MTVAGVLDPFDPSVRDDPFPVYRALRQRGRWHRTDYGLHLVPGYDDCAAVLSDPAWGHGYFDGINPFRPGVDPELLPGSFLLMDPPRHTRLRSLVSKAFTVRSVAVLRPRVERTVDRLLADMDGAGEVDLVAALAYPVPITTICEMLGVPARDHDTFGGWTADISRGLDPDGVLTEAEKTARGRAIAGFAGYFTDLIGHVRRRPGDDLLSRLATARGDDTEDRLTDKELVDICVLLLIAGHETTMNLISGGVLALHRHPAQRRLLESEPGLAGPAVEELLRYDTPVPFPTRTALRDTEVAGRRVPRGTGVVLLLGAADRDPAAFRDPDALDIRRFDGGGTRRHLAFSQGPHFCLGAPLARLEGQVVFERLYRRLPHLRVGDGPPQYRPSASMRGLARLPVHC